MASSKAAFLVLTSFLLVSSAVSSETDKELLKVVEMPGNEATPVKASPPPPLVRASPPPPTYAKASPPPPPVKAAAPPPTRPPVTEPPTLPPRDRPKTKEDCMPQCKDRCKLHSRQNICLRACVTCCVRCRCVPPGHYGNKKVCGKCYTDMTTTGGRPKCP